jgi:hypothetical protein
MAKPPLPGQFSCPAWRRSISGLPDRCDVAARSKLRSTWGDYVGVGCLGESELLLGRDLQERQGASGNEHDVRTQESCGSPKLERTVVGGAFSAILSAWVVDQWLSHRSINIELCR